MVSGSVDSGCHKLSEMYGLYGLKHHIVEMSQMRTDGRMTDGRTTSKDTATQLLICEKLSLANVYDVKSESLKFYFFQRKFYF